MGRDFNGFARVLHKFTPKWYWTDGRATAAVAALHHNLHDFANVTYRSASSAFSVSLFDRSSDRSFRRHQFSVTTANNQGPQVFCMHCETALDTIDRSHRSIALFPIARCAPCASRIQCASRLTVSLWATRVSIDQTTIDSIQKMPKHFWLRFACRMEACCMHKSIARHRIRAAMPIFGSDHMHMGIVCVLEKP